MSNTTVTEIKAFVPSKDFKASKEFYQEVGFTLASDMAGIAYFRKGEASFLLQDFYEEKHASSFMMHLLVEDLDAWKRLIDESGVAAKYGVSVTDVEEQPWGMQDFCMSDPSGVLWRIGQNV